MAVTHERAFPVLLLSLSQRIRYISALLLSLNTMLHLEMPHVNVLSKIDLIRQYGKLGAEGMVRLNMCP